MEPKTAIAVSTDRTLVEAIAGGDQQALRELNQRYGHALAAAADRILMDPSDAEVVAADVLWQVWRQSNGFDPQRGSGAAWLMTLVRSRAIDRLRARNVRSRVNAESNQVASAGDALAEVHGAEQRKIVITALNCLDVNERKVLELAYYSDLPQSAIAEQTGMPLGTVKTRMRNALIKLREELKRGLVR